MLNVQNIGRGLRNPRGAALYSYRKAVEYHRDLSVSVTSRRPVGTPAFEREWDLLIVLDSCRPDIMERVEDEYAFVDGVDRIWSVGGTSPEWMAHTFDRRWKDLIANTGYVTANPHSKSVFENRLDEHFRDSSRDVTALKRWGKQHLDFVRPEEMGRYEPVWKTEVVGEVEHHDLYGSPRTVTDHAIRLGREADLDRMVLHYMPLHVPYVVNARREEREPYDHEVSPWSYIIETGDRETVREACTDMLRWVLDEVELLLDNIEAERVVLTADHGDAFGEYRVYGHWAGSFHPNIRYVPWVVTSGLDSGTHEPEFEPAERNVSVEERLGALGYV